MAIGIFKSKISKVFVGSMVVSVVAASVLVTACSPSKLKMTQGNTRPPSGKITLEADLYHNSADTLANLGEQVIAPSTFVIADQLFSKALEKDPEHKRAAIYKGLLKPIMVLRGVGTRVKPLVRQHGNIQEHELSLSKIPASSSRDFILDGKEDIKNLTDIQNLLIQHRNAWIEYYSWLKSNENIDITLNVPIESDSPRDCKILSQSASGIKFECDWVDRTQKRMVAPDMIAFRQMAAAMALYFTVYTSYTIDGIEAFAKQNEGKSVDGQLTLAFLQSNPKAGKLRQDNTMKYIKLFSSDYASAWSYAITNQPNLCPGNKDNNEVKRPGFVMEKGHCINNESEERKSLDLLVQALAGPTQVNWTGQDNKPESTTIDYFAISTRPSPDLRTYYPTAFDGSCAVSYADPTLGGIFPKGDFNQLIPKCSQ